MPTPRILVVEDNALILELIVETLDEAGYDVDYAETADAAAALLEADGYQLLVTDVHMPGKLNGLDLAERAQNHEPPLPVVVVTARPDVVGRFNQSGIHGTALVKPFLLADLVQVVSRFVPTPPPA